MTSSNGNIFRVTGPLCGEFTCPGEFPAQSPVTRSFDVFFDLRLNKQLSKQPWGWWFETPSWSLWRQCNGFVVRCSGKLWFPSPLINRDSTRINPLSTPLWCVDVKGLTTLGQITTLRPWQNGRHFADDIFKCIFLNENVWILIKISLTFVPNGPIINIPALV